MGNIIPEKRDEKSWDILERYGIAHKILEANMAGVALRRNIILHHTMLFSLNLQKQGSVIMLFLQQKRLLDIFILPSLKQRGNFLEKRFQKLQRIAD